MGMADVATVLFKYYLRFNPKNPGWINRDRFVLSAGHGSMLLYSLLYLTGYKSISIKDIQNFRQLNSICAGHPEYKKNSLINLNDYILDKHERKIKRNNLEVKLSEKEINFLILFSKSKEPISRNLVLKNVWNYSLESETHTIETHIHRLRKKILQKFGDDNFIKNNNKGYYI